MANRADLATQRRNLIFEPHTISAGKPTHGDVHDGVHGGVVQRCVTRDQPVHGLPEDQSSRAEPVSGSADSANIADRKASIATAYLFGHHL